MPRKVDRFNVDGEDYVIEPILDPVPTEGSIHGVESGGVFNAMEQLRTEENQDKSDIPLQSSTKAFTAGGAYNFFDKSLNSTAWLKKVFPEKFGTTFTQVNSIKATVITKGDVYVISTYQQGLWWSEDGLTNWTQCTAEDNAWSNHITSGISYALIYDNGLFMAFIVYNNVGCIMYSEDGKVWKHSATAGSECIMSFKGVFIARFATNDFRWTEDAVNWTAIPNITGNINSMYSTARYYYGSNSTCLIMINTAFKIFVTEDGKNFTESSLALPSGQLAELIVREDYALLGWIDTTNMLRVYYSVDNGYNWAVAGEGYAQTARSMYADAHSVNVFAQNSSTGDPKQFFLPYFGPKKYADNIGSFTELIRDRVVTGVADDIRCVMLDDKVYLFSRSGRIVAFKTERGAWDFVRISNLLGDYDFFDQVRYIFQIGTRIYITTARGLFYSDTEQLIDL